MINFSAYIYEVFALNYYNMFWLKVHVIDVTICFYEHCIIHMQKVYTWNKYLFSMFLSKHYRESAFNRLSRNVYEMQKFWKETFTKEKFQKPYFFIQASKGKFWENEKNVLVFACSYHPLHKRAFLQSIRWLQPLLIKRLSRERSGDNCNADIWGSVGIDPPDKSWIARTVLAKGPIKWILNLWKWVL